MRFVVVLQAFKTRCGARPLTYAIYSECGFLCYARTLCTVRWVIRELSQ